MDNKLVFSSIATSIEMDQDIADAHAAAEIECDDASLWGCDPMQMAIHREELAGSEWDSNSSILNREEYMREHAFG